MRLILAFVFVLLSVMLRADPQSQSYSSWQWVDGQIQLRYTIPVQEVTRLTANPSELAKSLEQHIANTVRVTAGESVCETVAQPTQRAAKQGYLVIDVRFDCGPEATRHGALLINIGAMFDYAPSHVHFAKFAFDASRPFEQLFSHRQTSQAVALQADRLDSALHYDSNLATLAAYIVLGYQHILEGLDHIAFLLALIILSAKLRDILLIVTGFTLGHSITLSLAVLDIVRPNIALVESIIGLTIALVAIENVAVRSAAQSTLKWMLSGALLLLALLAVLTSSQTPSGAPAELLPASSGPPAISLLGLALFCYCYLSLSNSDAQARRYRPIITTIFGLVHGFGFANVLQEVGIPDAAVLPALFGFNIGVELGQIAIVLFIWLLGWLALLLFKRINRVLATDLLSALLCTIGVYWFVQRAYF